MYSKRLRAKNYQCRDSEEAGTRPFYYESDNEKMDDSGDDDWTPSREATKRSGRVGAPGPRANTAAIEGQNDVGPFWTPRHLEYLAAGMQAYTKAREEGRDVKPPLPPYLQYLGELPRETCTDRVPCSICIRDIQAAAAWSRNNAET